MNLTDEVLGMQHPLVRLIFTVVQDSEAREAIFRLICMMEPTQGTDDLPIDEVGDATMILLAGWPEERRRLNSEMRRLMEAEAARQVCGV